MPKPRTNSVYHFQGFVLDVSKRKLSNSTGQLVKLGSRAFDTLVELIHHEGELVSKDYLMNTIWPDMVVEENNLNRAIWNIRKALDDSSSDSKFIQTIPGRGYCFIAEIVKEEAPNQSPSESEVKKTIPNVKSQSETSAFMAVASHQYFKTGAVFLVVLLLFYLFFLPTPKINTEPDQVALTQLQAIKPDTAGSSNTVIPDSIAVMPFTNMNRDDDSELFVLSLHDELINQLSKIADLKVIARESVVSLYEDGKSVFEITELLNVESLIAGSILVLDDNARINLQMLDASTGVVLWADSLEVDIRDLSKMISIQSQIAHNVVNILEVEIQPEESENDIGMLSTQSFEAYRYLLAVHANYKHQDNKGKWVLVRKALDLDPEYSDALLLFASINSALAVTPLEGFTAKDHIQHMMDSTDAFIALKPERSEGYALKAVALGSLHDWEGVAQQIEILEELGATLAEMKHLGLLLMCFGDFKGAVKVYEDSLFTEPVNLYLRGFLMAAHEMAGNRERAREEYAIGSELKADWWGDSVNILLALGRNEPLMGVNELPDVSPVLATVLRHSGNPEVVARGVKNYINNDAKIPAEAIYYSALAAYYGDSKSATTLLRVSMDETSTSIFWGWLPVFDEVRRTKYFRNILVDYGLVSYWQKHGWPEVCQPNNDGFNCDWTAYSDLD